MCAISKVKVKQSHYRPGQALRVQGGWGSQISRHSVHEGGKVVSLTHRPPLPPRKYSWYSFLLETFRLVAQCLNQLRHRLLRTQLACMLNLQKRQVSFESRARTHTHTYRIQYWRYQGYSEKAREITKILMRTVHLRSGIQMATLRWRHGSRIPATTPSSSAGLEMRQWKTEVRIRK